VKCHQIIVVAVIVGTLGIVSMWTWNQHSQHCAVTVVSVGCVMTLFPSALLILPATHSR